MLAGDDASQAYESAGRLDPEGSASHFHDPAAIVGKAVAAALGGQGAIAWDVYLLFPPGGTWEGSPPAPLEWFHQLGDDAWADAAHYRTGEALRESLRLSAARLAQLDLSC